jgi:hypothetical protein
MKRKKEWLNKENQMKRAIYFLVFALIGSGLFSQSADNNPVKVLGWSRDGKVAVIKNDDGMGGFTAFIFNAVTDTILWERGIHSYEYDSQKAFNSAVSATTNNFQRMCQQHKIVMQDTRPMRPVGSKILHNGDMYTISINIVENKEEMMITSYSVIAEINGKRKTLSSKDTYHPASPYFYLYYISPYEERALIILRFPEYVDTVDYAYIGCNLTTGFR